MNRPYCNQRVPPGTVTNPGAGGRAGCTGGPLSGAPAAWTARARAGRESPDSDGWWRGPDPPPQTTSPSCISSSGARQFLGQKCLSLVPIPKAFFLERCQGGRWAATPTSRAALARASQDSPPVRCIGCHRWGDRGSGCPSPHLCSSCEPEESLVVTY